MTKRNTRRAPIKKRIFKAPLFIGFVAITLSLLLLGNYHFKPNDSGQVLGKKSNTQPRAVFIKTGDKDIDNALYYLTLYSAAEAKIVLSEGHYGIIAGEFQALRDMLKVPSTRRPVGNQNQRKNFCQTIGLVTSEQRQVLLDNKTNLENKHKLAEVNLDKQYVYLDAERQESRSIGDEKWQEAISKLTEKAQTPTQQQAVMVFKTTVEQAIATRRSTIDSAITSLRQNFEQAHSLRQTSMDAGVSELLATVDVANQNAISNCSKRAGSMRVRSAYTQWIKEGRDQFQAKWKTDSAESTSEALINSRKDLVQKANQDFRITVQAAANTLKPFFN